MYRSLQLAAGAVALSTSIASSSSGRGAQPPHILFIIADDLGWNDISLHGSPQIPTPNIDALAADGVTLFGYRTQPVCSPSRASLLTGRHSIHHGVYMPFNQGTADHLNTSYTLLPQYLKNCCNYSTHLSGKWHLGQNTLSTLPTYRGFDSHLGYWSGAEDHYNHSVDGAYDFTDNLTPAVADNNTFSTPLFAERAIEIINSFGPGGSMEGSGQPMFLYLAFQDVHVPLQAPQEYIDRFANTTGGNVKRQMVCAMAAFMDEALGNVTSALEAAGMYDDSLVVFVSDNGGPTNGFEGTEANNYPMRGGKNSIWEGGTRVIGIVRGAGIQPSVQGTVSNEKLHVTDWLPTLVSMASGQNWTNYIPPNDPPFQYGDGMNVWDTISTGAPSTREWILLETHQQDTNNRIHGDGLIVGDWKLLKWNNTMPTAEDGWFPPAGQNPNTTPYRIGCDIAKQPATVDPTECNADWCLFNVTADPCEYKNLASQHPAIVKQMLAQLAPFQSTAVPAEVPSGCNPVQLALPSGALVWRPCDAPPPGAPVQFSVKA